MFSQRDLVSITRKKVTSHKPSSSQGVPLAIQYTVIAQNTSVNTSCAGDKCGEVWYRWGWKIGKENKLDDMLCNAEFALYPYMSIFMFLFKELAEKIA